MENDGRVLTLFWRERAFAKDRQESDAMMQWRVYSAEEITAVNARSEHGHRWLCYYCSQVCDSDNGKCEEGAPFCSSACVENWAVQVGLGNAPRASLFARERGVCQGCRLDCHAFWLRLRPLDAMRRRSELLSKMPRLTERRRERIIQWCHEGDIWQADHKVAVVHGGGESCMESQNLQTLCVPCHLEKTTQDRVKKAKVL